MPLENPWIGYLDRTYQQIKSTVLTYKQSLTPEITDDTESNPPIKWLSIWSGIAEMLGYYVDNMGREAHLTKARLYRSGIKHAKSRDYRVHSKVASTGDVVFTMNSVHGVDVLIPQDTELEDTEGRVWYTVADVSILAGQLTATVSARQSVPVTGVALGNSTGAEDQEIVIDDDVADGSVAITVNAVAWTPVQTLGRELPDAEVFMQTMNELKKVVVRFGDNWAGKVPTGGQAIVAEYGRTTGENAGANTITTINTALSLPVGKTVTVTNPGVTSGGSDIESLAEMKLRIPKSTRTLLRAVTDDDYEDLAELKTGVAKAKATFACGVGAEVWIVPTGGGIASDILVGDTQTWMNDYSILGRNPTVRAAGEVKLKLKFRVNIGNQYVRSTTVALIKSNFEAFFATENQEIKGSIFKSDMYEVMETTKGVLNSELEIMKTIPYARILSGTTALTWTREVTDNNTTNTKWKIVMTSGTVYQLFKNGSYVGTHNTGDLISKPEIEFTVTPAAYSIGDQWEFWSYRSSGNILLEEMSIPAIDPNDIEIIANGGLL